MYDLPCCPKCNCEFTYQNGSLCVCPECAHESDAHAILSNDDRIYRDSGGNKLQDGDTIIVIKDLKVNGSSRVVKMGTQVKNIHIVDSDHNIDCKIDGIGAMSLKSEFVRKA